MPEPTTSSTQADCIGGGYAYVGHGDDCVMVAFTVDVRWWRSSVWFTPEQGRRLAARLLEQVEQSETGAIDGHSEHDRPGTELRHPGAARPGRITQPAMTAEPLCKTCSVDSTTPRSTTRTVANAAADEIESLRSVVRLLVDRFHDETPMGPNVIDLPDVRWRILPPSMAQSVKRALDNARGSNDA